MVFPWRLPLEGIWHCEPCRSKAQQVRNDKVGQRGIISIRCLPPWFLEWGAMTVRRSDGTLLEMTIDDVPGDKESLNDVVARWGGRVRLDNGAIYIDMCFHQRRGQFHRKSTLLSNILENNPDLLNQPMLAINFPEWVATDELRERWNTSIAVTYAAAKKNMIGATEDTDEEDTVVSSRRRPMARTPSIDPAASPIPAAEPISIATEPTEPISIAAESISIAATSIPVAEPIPITPEPTEPIPIATEPIPIAIEPIPIAAASIPVAEPIPITPEPTEPIPIAAEPISIASDPITSFVPAVTPVSTVASPSTMQPPSAVAAAPMQQPSAAPTSADTNTSPEWKDDVLFYKNAPVTFW
jgi:hypothetical protein